MSKEEKDKIIRQIYYDADTGFGSIADTYKASKKVLIVRKEILLRKQLWVQLGLQ